MLLLRVGLLLFLGLQLSRCQQSTDQQRPAAEHQVKPSPAPKKIVTTAPGVGMDGFPGDGSTLTNVDTLRADLELRTLLTKPRQRRLRVAVMDNGFSGLKSALGRTLPSDGKLIASSGNQLQDSTHGVKIAEVVQALCCTTPAPNTKLGPESGPEFYFLNSNGFTNFVAAIDWIVENKPDLVLYAQIWEYGGNLDGEGFINAQVNRAVQAGALWINASGNYGKSSLSAPVVIEDDLVVKLPYGGRFMRLTVPQDFTPVKIVLAWNDFDQTEQYATTQDLDLELYDQNQIEIAASRLIQDGGPVKDSQHSAHAREILRVTLNAGVYFIGVQAKSTNFDANSRLTISADGWHVTTPDSGDRPVVLIPADNARVLTVGAADVTYTNTNGTDKPDVEVPSTLYWSSGFTVDGSSAAAAVAAGALTAYLERLPTLPAERTLREMITNGPLSLKPEGRRPFLWLGSVP